VHIALGLVLLAVTVIAGSALARRWDFPAPVLLVAVGALGSVVPGVPEVQLTAELVLVGLLPPLLYSAALQTSLIDFTAHRRSILSLSIGLVAFTTVGVAVVVHALIPDVGWPTAFALGAVVAPPDAVAATAIGRRIGLPRRTVAILEGESLLNDATALVALKSAILAGAGAATVLGTGVDFVRTAVGGVVCGVLVFAVVGWVRRHLTDPVLDTSVSLVTPFIAYVAAEEIHASGVLAVVIAGLLLGHKAPVLQTAPSRIAERLNWRTISFLLENAVFLLIGLQAESILEGVADSSLDPGRIAAVCLAVLVSVIVLRMVWVFPARYLLTTSGTGAGQRPPWTYTAVIGWAGMRGVVTLAAAFVIPAETEHREVLLLVAFAVTAGTLVLHGLTLPRVARRLKVPSPDPREDALVRAELLQQASQAGLARLAELEGADDGVTADVAVVLRTRLEQRDFAAWERLGPDGSEGETPSEEYARLRLAMLHAERERVLELRSQGRPPHEVVENVLATLDIEESMIDHRQQRRKDFDMGVTGEETVRARDECEHLAGVTAVPEVTDRRCEDCVREGSTWVHLRTCVACGHVGCCDSSPRRHASAHFTGTEHPVVASAEPGETWRWCFVDELVG
jgi:Na+/H+ antiporter